MSRMEQNETGCETPQTAILCVNNCGFFGTAATMNMCSKCYKDLAMKQDQTKLAASSIQSLVNGRSNSEAKDPDFAIATKAEASSSRVTFTSEQIYSALSDGGTSDELNHGPKRCGACKKRVGLTGFNCRCGHIFCSVHRYSDKHDCPFNYRAAGQEAIAKANPVVKSHKLDRI